MITAVTQTVKRLAENRKYIKRKLKQTYASAILVRFKSKIHKSSPKGIRKTMEKKMSVKSGVKGRWTQDGDSKDGDCNEVMHLR